MAQGRAKAFLRQKSNDAYNDLMDQWDDIQEGNAAAQNRSGWGRLLGSGLGMFLASTGVGLPLWAAMAATGLGSRLGSEIGEHTEGKWWKGFGGEEGLDWGKGVQGGEAIKSVGLRSDVKRELASDADTLYDGFDDEQNINAILDSVSAYVAGGGFMPGDKTGSFKANLGKNFKRDSLYDFFLNKISKDSE